MSDNYIHTLNRMRQWEKRNKNLSLYKLICIDQYTLLKRRSKSEYIHDNGNVIKLRCI